MTNAARRILPLALVLTVGFVTPALAAKAKKPPAPMKLYPSAESCQTGSGTPTFVLDTTADNSNTGCASLVVGVQNGMPAGPRADEDYEGTGHALKSTLAKSGAVTGTITVVALIPETTNTTFAGVADVVLTLTINGQQVGAPIEKQGAIAPGSPLSIPVSLALPASLKGKKVKEIDLLVHWKIAGGTTFLDYDHSYLTIPRS